MKFLEIEASCVLNGRNAAAGELIPIEEVRPADLAILCGSQLAQIVERFPVEAPEQSEAPEDEEAPKPKKGKKR